jgi:hypothetical protein
MVRVIVEGAIVEGETREGAIAAEITAPTTRIQRTIRIALIRCLRRRVSRERETAKRSARYKRSSLMRIEETLERGA